MACLITSRYRCKEAAIDKMKQLTVPVGTQVGLSPLLILSISSARSLVSSLASPTSAMTFLDGKTHLVSESGSGPSPNSVVIL